jgi:hypothetical protein
MLRMAIRANGLTLHGVCKRLAEHGYQAGVSTVGDWQHGRSRPASVPAVLALEEILSLPPHTLVSLIPRLELSERCGALGELLDTLPGSRDRNVDLLSQQDRVWVNAASQIWRISSQLVLRARRDGVDRYVLRLFAEPRSTLSRVDIEAIANCTVGQVRRHGTAPVIVVELLFGQRLRANETWLLEYRWTNQTGGPSSLFAHAVRHRVEQYVLEIRFDAGAPPIECHAFTQSDFYDPVRPTTVLPVSTHRTVHLLGTPLLTGLHGIGWRLQA